ncbi:MAG: PAS domain-containing protein [Acidobacteriota bacterium]
MTAALEQAATVGEALARLFHPFVEVVVHDLASGRISAIFNPLSRRSVGDDSRVRDRAGLAAGPDVHGPFEQRGLDGRRQKYVSVVWRDEMGEAVGLLCINMDLGVLDRVQEVLGAFLQPAGDSAALDAHFRDDWQDRVRSFVGDYCRRHGLPTTGLARERRRDLVAALQEAGGLRAKNAAAFVANVLGVSRATVYNDLAALKEKDRGG